MRRLLERAWGLLRRWLDRGANRELPVGTYDPYSGFEVEDDEALREWAPGWDAWTA